MTDGWTRQLNKACMCCSNGCNPQALVGGICEAHSLFDFGSLAAGYERWYCTPAGKTYDREEKAAVLRLLPPPKPGDRLLDVGCGTGHWSRFFASLGFQVIGVDISAEMVDVACSHDSPRCRFGIADACRLPFDEVSFDVVTAIATLEFVSDLEAAVAEMFRCTKLNGSVIIGALNKLAPLNRQRVAQGEEPYASARLFSPQEVRAVLARYGRVRMRVSGHQPEHKWTRSLRVLRRRSLLRGSQRTGVFIVAAVRSGLTTRRPNEHDTTISSGATSDG